MAPERDPEERDAEERAREHASTLARVDPRWDTAHTERTLAGLHRRRRARRRSAKVVAGALVVAACTLAVWVARDSHASPPVATEPAEDAPDRVVRLADGSRVVPEENARVIVEQVTDSLIEVRVVEGGVAFDVVPGLPRRFEVRAGEVTVRVLGTSFRVEPIDAARAYVSVTRGHVEVTWATGRADLRAGEDGTFPVAQTGGPGPPVEPPPEASTGTPVVAVVAGARGAERRGASVTDPPPGPASAEPVGETVSWRELAHESRYEEAYEALEAAVPRAGTVRVRDAAEDLLLAADVARLSGHPAAAIPWLEAVERDHGTDPRAVLATFTRGRILTELGRPAEGALALERVLEREPNGSLAEDALARASLAHAAAGHGDRAAALAERYLAAHPAGRWSSRLRALGTGDAADR